MNKIITYIATAIVPVFLTWALVDVKAPDSVDHIDYSSGGTELINSKEQLTSSLKIQAGDKPVEKLSIYNIRFANNSSKNLQKLQVEFKIKAPPGSELLASAIKGPQDYSDSLIRKVNESKSAATYSFEFINVAPNISRDYFTASFLFSGEPPESITPVSLSPSVGFIDSRENNKVDIIATAIIITFLFLYLAFIWWAIASGKKEGRARQEKFEQEVASHLNAKLSLPGDQATQITKELMVLKDSIFKPDSRLKKWLKTWLST